MRSIALFPCSYTNGATVIGELISSLHLPVYTDARLLAEVSEQFGIMVEKLNKIIFMRLPALNRYLLQKEKYINCLKCSLDAQLRSHTKGRIHYGLHTSLLDSEYDRVLKVLMFDREDRRVERAMQQEGFTEKKARLQVQKDDKKASDWTSYLFHKQAYDRSLYDVVIDLKNRHVLDIAAELIASSKATANLYNLFPVHSTLPILNNQISMSEQMKWVN